MSRIKGVKAKVTYCTKPAVLVLPRGQRKHSSSSAPPYHLLFREIHVLGMDGHVLAVFYVSSSLKGQGRSLGSFGSLW